MADPGRELAVVGQDPRYGGGFVSQLAEFWAAARALGHDPRLYYLSRGAMTSIVGRTMRFGQHEEVQREFAGVAFPSLLPELDAFNQITGGHRMARRLDRLSSVWVVAASAPYGYAALRSRRPYACWLGTGLESEWAGRRAGLEPLRRIALAVNAPVLRHLERAVIRNATAVYATSPASRKTIADAGRIPQERIRILPIPVDLTRFTPEPDDVWRARVAQPTLVFVGRPNDPRKNLRLLLQAFPRVRERIPGLRLRIVGTQSMRRQGTDDDLALELRRLSSPGVEWLGGVPSVADVVRSATLLVLPSLQEGFGIVVAEALACGVPAVVAPCGGPEDLIRDSRGGVLLASFRVEELAARLVDVLGNEDRLLRMRASGRSYVERHHSPERLQEKLGAAIAELEAGH